MSIQTRRLLPRLIFAGAKLPLLDGISKYFQPKNSRPHDSWGPVGCFSGLAGRWMWRGLIIHVPPSGCCGLWTGHPPTKGHPLWLRDNCHGISSQLPRTIVTAGTDYRANCHGCCPNDRGDCFEAFLPSPQPHPATLLAAWPFSRLLGPWVKKSAAIIYRYGKI